MYNMRYMSIYAQITNYCKWDNKGKLKNINNKFINEFQSITSCHTFKCSIPIDVALRIEFLDSYSMPSAVLISKSPHLIEKLVSAITYILLFSK